MPCYTLLPGNPCPNHLTRCHCHNFLAFIFQALMSCLVRLYYLFLAENKPNSEGQQKGSYLFRLIQLPVNSSEECSKTVHRDCSQRHETKKTANFWDVMDSFLDKADVFPLARINRVGVLGHIFICQSGSELWLMNSSILKRHLNKPRNSSFEMIPFPYICAVGFNTFTSPSSAWGGTPPKAAFTEQSKEVEITEMIPYGKL